MDKSKPKSWGPSVIYFGIFFVAFGLVINLYFASSGGEPAAGRKPH
jgi:hypothetical protein